MNTLKLQNSIFKVLIEIFIWNKKTRSRTKARWAKLHLKKHVDYAIKNTNITTPTNNLSPKVIWQYWHQGEENAPKIIQKCLASIKKFHPEYEIKVLSFETIKNFVNIPQKYYDLLEQKKIPIAIFSDIVRLYLLTQHGGLWIDSTIYLTDRIPDDILNSSFFVYQKDPKTDNFEDKMSCFFIKANSDDKMINLIRNAIESYWQENDYLVHYFIFEHIVTMLSDSNSELKQKWNSMPYYSADNIGYLQKIMFEEYNEERFEEIKTKTSVHKLTYKKDSTPTSGNSFYDYLLKNNY